MKYQHWFLLLIGLFPAWIQAAIPAAPIELELNQSSDGYQFIGMPKGDRYGDWVETEDGYTIVKDNGDWYYAELDENGQLVASDEKVSNISQSPGYMSSQPTREKHLKPVIDSSQFEVHVPPKREQNLMTKSLGFHDHSHDHTISFGPAVVNQSVLVILLSFSDISFNYSASSFQTLMFGASSSVKDYFDEVSYGNFNIVPATESYGTSNDGIIEVTLGTAHPNSGSSSSPTMVNNAFNGANAYIDYSAYDTNGDGVVSSAELSIVIIAAGYENSYGGAGASTPRIWGHKSSITPVTYDGVDLSPYTAFGERHETHQATIGIMIHELGHLMLGLPDLYDRDGSSSGVGSWGVMGGGSWNYTGSYAGDSPAHMMGWIKIRAGFVNPEDIRTAGTYDFDLTADDVVKRISTDKYGLGEHFLVEKRHQTGYDAGLPGGGFLITHIDPSVTSQNDTESHKLVDVEEADNLAELDSGGSADAGDVFPGTTSNTTFNNTSGPNSKNYSNASTGIVVENIDNDALGTTSVDITPMLSDVGGHISYDEYDAYSGANGYYSGIPIYSALKVTNTSAYDTIDGVELYTSVASDVNIYIYDTISNSGTLGTLLYTEPATKSTSVGWNRLLLTTPQSFAEDASVVFVLSIDGGVGNSAAHYDSWGVVSNTSFLGSSTGTLSQWGNGDLNQKILMSNPISVANTAPVITGQSALALNEDDSLTITVSDLTITDADGDTSFTLTVNSGSNYTVSSNTITPTADYNGSLTVPVTVNDGTDDSSVYNLSVTVNAQADAPVITAQSPLALNEDDSLTINVSDLTITDADGDTSFTLTVGTGSDYSVSTNTITPDADFNGSLTVPVTVNDGGLDSSSYDLTVTVNPQDDAPVITGQSTLTMNQGGNLTLTASDLTITDADGDTSFTLTVNSGSNYTVSGTTITADSTYQGTLTVPVTVNDGTLDSSTFNLSVSVTVGNNPPSITGQSALSVNEDNSLTLSVSDLTVTDSDGDSSFTLSVSSGSDYTVSGSTITPDANFYGTLTVPVTVNDGTDDSASYNVSVTVNAVNDAPVITGQDDITLNPGVFHSFDLNDLTVTDVDNTYPQNFTVSISDGDNYQVLGSLIIPSVGFSGTLSVPVTVNDGGLDSNSYNFQITVSPAVVVVPTITEQDDLTINEDETLTLSLDHFDVSDEDSIYPDDFTLTIESGDNYTSDGLVVIPDENFHGVLTVNVTVSDGENTSESFEVDVTVTPVNDAPDIVDQLEELEVTAGEPLTIDIDFFEVVDPDHDISELTLEIKAGRRYEIDGDTVTFDSGTDGIRTVNIVVTDGELESEEFSVEVDVIRDAVESDEEEEVVEEEETSAGSLDPYSVFLLLLVMFFLRHNVRAHALAYIKEKK